MTFWNNPKDFCRHHCRWWLGCCPHWCCPCKCHCHPYHKPQTEKKFLASYIEAVGNTQQIENDTNIAFVVTEEALDIAGNAITIDETGTIFTITKAGLYHIEWSLNLASGTSPIIVGLLENGSPSSALANNDEKGNYSSGALINVTNSDLPFTISLHNFGGLISITNPTGFEGVAASIRILRFADGPT